MTTGEYLSSISTVSNTAALTHFLNIETGTGGSITIKKIKSFNIVYKPIAYIININKRINKITLGTKVYKIVYNPKSLKVTNKTPNTVIKKGCST